MDTRWNNMKDKMKVAFAHIVEMRYRFLGILSVLGGFWIFLYSDYYNEHNYFSFEARIACFVLANIVVGVGNCLLTNYNVDKRYKKYVDRNELTYTQWKENVSQLIKIPYKKVIGWFLLALFYDYVCYYTNAFFAITFFCVQMIICQSAYAKHMQKKLDTFMEQMEETNAKNIERALESERKSLEKMSRSDQLRIDLITNVSHDLKTPVTSMVGYLELMKKEELSDAARDYVEVLCSKTDKLKEMINSLFSLAKASSGSVELHMEKFELNRLLEQIMADMKDRIDESELDFVRQMTEQNTEITSDNMYFYRICQNLLENALKYSLKGSRVFIKTYVKEKEKLCLEITNTAGYSMDFEKEDILERFARGDKSRSTDGNGLGLAIVSAYVKALGGEFDIKMDCDQFKACLEFPRNKN